MANQFFFRNFLAGELLSGITAVTTELNVGPTLAAKIGSFIVGQNLEIRLTLWDGQNDPEIVGCVENDGSGVIKVNRGQENTTPVAWPAGTQIRCALTEAVINQALLTAINTVELLQQAFLPLTGGTLTGPLLLAGDPATNNEAVRKVYVDSVLGNKLPLSGGTMSGAVNMNSNRILSLPAAVSNGEPVRKAEFDTATQVRDNVDKDRSGTLITSGSSVAYTVTTNQTMTALTDGFKLSVRPHVNNDDSATLDVNSLGAQPIQEFPGVLITEGALLQDIPIDLMFSTAYSAWIIVGPKTGPRTGDVKLTYSSTADPGWLKLTDGTIGNGLSSASSASNNNRALFMKYWDEVPNTDAPVSTGRGASALADWNAGKSLSTAVILGRALAAAGDGAGLTSRTVGKAVGAEGKTFLKENLPATTFVVTIPAGQGNHSHTGSTTGRTQGNTVAAGGDSFAMGPVGSVSINANTLPAMTGTADSGGTGILFDVVQPTSFLNVMVKR